MFAARITPVLVAAALSLCSASAFAQEGPAAAPAAKSHFGDSGQFALSLNESFAVNTADILSGSQLQASYFVADNLSLGLGVGAQWISSSPVSGSSSQFIFRVGPRIGYDIRLSDFVSIWPQMGIDYRRTDSSSGNAVTSMSSTSNAVGFAAAVPVLIHPTKGFFLGAGPAFYSEFANSTSTGGTTLTGSNGGASTDNGKVTSVGLMATIGGAI